MFQRHPRAKVAPDSWLSFPTQDQEDQKVSVIGGLFQGMTESLFQLLVVLIKEPDVCRPEQGRCCLGSPTLRTTPQIRQAQHAPGWLQHQLTMVLECFHFVSLFKIRSRLMQEKRFLQQNWLLSPASCREARDKHNHRGCELLSSSVQRP